MTKWVLGAALLSITLIGCVGTRPIDDRLSYDSQHAIEQSSVGVPSPIFAIAPDSRHLIVEQGPSGPFGAALIGAFPIGASFSAYLEQAQRAWSRGRETVPVQVSFKVSEWEYTNSAASTIPSADWVKIALRIESQYPGSRKKEKVYSAEVDLAWPESATGPADRAFVLALEQLLKQYLIDVQKELTGGNK